MTTQTVPYACRPYTGKLNMSAYNRVRPRADDQPWMPVVTEPRVILPSRGQNLNIGYSQEQEFFRVRTQSHLYEPWHVDMVMDQIDARTHGSALNYDCRKCRSTVLIKADATHCPTCRGRI